MTNARTISGFRPDTELGNALLTFVNSLGTDRASRAALVRCRAPVDVIAVPEYHRLCARLQPLIGEDFHWQERMAAVVGLLSTIKSQDDDQGLALRMARTSGDRPRVSELRFRRLLKTEGRDAERFYPAMRRILALLDYKANPLELARATYFWDDRFRGPGIRRDWAFAYFSALPNRKLG